jgi:crotonobetainyl-CoA:carnitine CoA-transferase CaiB-like acyl-CoA transferase
VSQLPLAGVRVLDLTRVVAGPYCTMILGDLGADVLKIENPDGGDDTRRFGPPFVGSESAYFLGINRNKLSVTVNLKDPRGQELTRELARASDVFIENMRPGSLERWSLDGASLRAINPRLVTGSLSAFGTVGPYRDDPGYDFPLQALGGLMSITGEANGPPMKVGVALIDVIAGLYCATAILAALRVRDQTGRGQQVDVSLLESGLSALINVASGYLISGERPGRYGNAHASIVPYQVFDARDRPFALGVANDKQFASLGAILHRPEWAEDPRFATNPARVANRVELIGLLELAFAERDAAEWVGDLRAAGIPCAPINNVDEAFEHEQVKALGVVETVEHPTAGPIRLVRPPFHLSETPPEIRRPPPRLGEHTDEVLREVLRMDLPQIQELRQAGVV